jgi:hypothetical protein
MSTWSTRPSKRVNVIASYRKQVEFLDANLKK